MSGRGAVEVFPNAKGRAHQLGGPTCAAATASPPLARSHLCSHLQNAKRGCMLEGGCAQRGAAPAHQSLCKSSQDFSRSSYAIHGRPAVEGLQG